MVKLCHSSKTLYLTSCLVCWDMSGQSAPWCIHHVCMFSSQCIYVEVVATFRSARLCKISGALQCVEIPIRLDLQETACFWEIPQSTPIKAEQLATAPHFLCSQPPRALTLSSEGSLDSFVSAEKWPWHRKLVLFCWLLLRPLAFSSLQVSAKKKKNPFSNGCCVSSIVL